MPKHIVCLTFDFDGISGFIARGAVTPTPVSRGEFGPRVGAPRLLALLRKYRIKSSWYVPGHTIETFPDAVRSVVEHGHEIGHHGWRHISPVALSRAEEEAELVRGNEAIMRISGEYARGYRSPGWELTPATLELLPELGFAWDSSLMADERPYRLGELVELPVHWRLDDVPYWLAYRDPREVLAIWTAEYDAADGGHITFTIHPEHTGRGHRLTLLDGLLDHIGPTVKHSDACAALI